MKVTLNAIGIVVLAAIALIGAIVLVALGKVVPEFLSLVAISGLGAVAGITVPASPPANVDLAGLAAALLNQSAPAAAPAPAPAAATTVTSAPATVTTITTPNPVPAATPATDQAAAFAPAAVPPVV
jgi:hypothetical protein